jgi:hypothetical protein
MGSGKAGWDPEHWVPLCRNCHDTLDARTGCSGKEHIRRQSIIAVLTEAKEKGHWPPVPGRRMS